MPANAVTGIWCQYPKSDSRGGVSAPGPWIWDRGSQAHVPGKGMLLSKSENSSIAEIRVIRIQQSVCL